MTTLDGQEHITSISIRELTGHTMPTNESFGDLTYPTETLLDMLHTERIFSGPQEIKDKIEAVLRDRGLTENEINQCRLITSKPRK